MMKRLNATGSRAGRGRQGGAVLIFCLVFLAILTMMGVSGMESTVLEERMSGNMRDHATAFQAAESALKEAEAWLINRTTLPVTSDDGTTTVWNEDAADPDVNDGLYWWDHGNVNDTWWDNNGIELTGDVAGVQDQPAYLIEEYRTVDSGQSLAIGSGENNVPRTFHRITARGVGVNPTTEVTVQTTFVRTY